MSRAGCAWWCRCSAIIVQFFNLGIFEGAPGCIDLLAGPPGFYDVFPSR